MSSIGEYALIGNCRTSALVSESGSIDWCCMPEFHSPAIFSALLDNLTGGHFSICPKGEYKSNQKYLGYTNMIETVFTISAGEVRLLDGFTAMEEEDKVRGFFPDHEIIRVVEGISGVVPIRMEFFPRLLYGKSSPTLKRYNEIGIGFSYRENTFFFQSTLKYDAFVISDSRIILDYKVRAGERILFSLSCSGQSPAIIPELKTTGWMRFQKSVDYWKNWISECTYRGKFKDQVLRSALALKLLTYAPSGAIIAAPTTSLPEAIGGERNWDYRYCWLRDASFTVRVLIKLGFYTEARAYMNWILHATRLTRPKLRVVYSVYGDAGMREKECGWLAGYKNSKPVRTGNSAHEQFQLDVYGEVLDAVYSYSQIEKAFDRDTRKFIIGLGKEICKLWKKPDAGIWEIRSSSVHHTHSKVMAWVGLDRILKLIEKFGWKTQHLAEFRKTRDMIREFIENDGFNEKLNSYTREIKGSTPDASLLILPLVDYPPVDSERTLSTMEYLWKHLGSSNLIYRYRSVDDGLSGTEGAFIACSFWFIENLAKTGKVDEAVGLFEETVKYASRTGLFPEEIDPETKELLGNYPQGFSHIGLINAALTIDEVYQK